jgi:hypothetical protein
MAEQRWYDWLVLSLLILFLAWLVWRRYRA